MNYKLSDCISFVEEKEFFQNNELDSIDLNQAKTIGYSAFEECRFLKQIFFHPDTEMIHSYAFQKCSSLKKIQIPEFEELVVEACAFIDCPLETVDFGSRTDFSKIYDNTLLIAGERCPICKNKVEVTRDGISCSHCDRKYTWNALDEFKKLHLEPSGVLKEFTGFSGILSIPEGITAIAPQAFDDSCAFSVKIPSTVSKIGTRAFHWTDRMTGISFKTHTLKRLESQTFTSSLIHSFYCPENLEYIGRNAFHGCPLLSTVHLTDSVKMIGNSAFRECKNLEDLEIGDGVNVIGAHAFAQNENLGSVTIPSSVLTLEHHCFHNCSNLTHVTIEEGLLNIGDYAFFNCENLKEIILPDSLLSIGTKAFRGCKNLRKVELPAALANMNLWNIFEPETELIYRM